MIRNILLEASELPHCWLCGGHIEPEDEELGLCPGCIIRMRE